MNTPLRLKRSSVLFGVISTTNKLKPTLGETDEYPFSSFYKVTECRAMLVHEVLKCYQNKCKEKSTVIETKGKAFAVFRVKVSLL